MSIIALCFICWDSYFTKEKIWGFNPEYLCGIRFFNLPLEEVLFFFTVPFSSIFIYSSVLHLLKTHPFSTQLYRAFSILLCLICLIAIVGYSNRYYTVSTALVTLALLSFCLLTKWDKLPYFIISYGIILIPFLLVNGILTGSGIDKPVVWYNNAHNVGIRIGTIPIEDTLYGLSLILSNAWLFEYFNNTSLRVGLSPKVKSD